MAAEEAENIEADLVAGHLLLKADRLDDDQASRVDDP